MEELVGPILIKGDSIYKEGQLEPLINQRMLCPQYKMKNILQINKV
jgi:hypothetical protein